MQIEQLKVADLTAYARNSRTHSAEQINQVAASIKEFGFTNPVLIDKTGEIIAGHGRVMACKQLGIDNIPCIRLDHLTDAQKRAYVIADNKLAENSGWNADLLALELAELKTLDFDLDLLGFETKELLEFIPDMPAQGLTDDDAVPEIPEQPATALGDVWLCGQHRVMCGDSTDKNAVSFLMNDKKAEMVFTSPPYNANGKAGQGDIFNKKKSVRLYSEGYQDNLDSFNYVKFAQLSLDICFIFTEGFIFWNVNYNANSRYEYIKQIEKKIDYLIEQVCWKKTSTIPFKGSLMRDWEPIFIFSTNKKKLSLDFVTSNHWIINNTGSQTKDHKACFPVSLPLKGISIIKKVNGIIFDPFLGSGTTMIAAEKTGRICYGMELDPKYCDVIVNRWQDFTGQQATLENDGRSFAEIKASRCS